MTSEAEALSTVLPGAATSPRLARLFVTDALHRWSLEGLRDSVELLTTELVTNVVLHVRGDLILRLLRLPELLRVEVSDGSPVKPEHPHFVDDDVEGATGRGLLLVEALADAWGVETADDGKTVWFEVVA